jgi:predicted anti-sigma-YlaC factor YlaD
MSCLDVRRALLADPGRIAANESAHLLTCEACRRYAAEAAARERLIDHALHVPLPPGFERRLLEVRRRRPIGRLRGTIAAVLAALVIAAIAAIAQDDPLALAGIDFVVRDEAETILAATGGDARALWRVAAELGLALPVGLGEIRYVGTCPFAGSTAHHAVLRTPAGKVTLLLLPDRPLASRVTANDRGLAAAVRPAGRGSIAIVTDSARELARTESLLSGRV